MDEAEVDRYLVEGLSAVPEGLVLDVAVADGVHGFLDAPTDRPSTLYRCAMLRGWLTNQPEPQHRGP